MRALSLKRVLTLLALGNIVEYYDFALYGFMASVIAELFFPAYDPSTAIILSLGVFALGFIARPMGAMVLGYIGDKWGGLISLRISLFGMAIATLSIGLLPTYQTLGIWAPIILTVLRMIQGMSMGAEFSTSLMTAAEYNNNRYPLSLVGAVLTGATVVGWFVGSGVVFLCRAFEVDYWWRLPFILGSSLTYIGYYLRKQLRDFQYASCTSEVILSSLMKENLYNTIASFFIASFIGALFYTFFLFPSIYLVRYIGLTEADVSKYVMFTLATDLTCLSIMWKIVEWFGIFRVMGATIIGGILVSYFLFSLLSYGGPEYIWIVRVASVVLICGVIVPYTTLLIQIFNTKSKYTAAATSYTLGTAIMGGISPMVLTYGIEKTQNIMIPGIYLSMCAGLALIGYTMLYKR